MNSCSTLSFELCLSGRPLGVEELRSTAWRVAGPVSRRCAISLSPECVVASISIPVHTAECVCRHPDFFGLWRGWRLGIYGNNERCYSKRSGGTYSMLLCVLKPRASAFAAQPVAIEEIHWSCP